MTQPQPGWTPRPDAAASLKRLAESRFGTSVDKISGLAGDASDRKYARLHHPGSTPPTSMGMIHASGFDEDKLPFLNVQAHFRDIGLPVPEIYGADPGAGVLLLEDAGGDSLEDVWETGGREVARPFYHEAIRQLATLREGTKNPGGGSHRLALSYGFDEALFERELHMTRRYAFEELLNTPAPEDEFHEPFAALAGALCRLPFALTHRDFHSRNLMAQGDFSDENPGRLVILDFQDARLGPVTYDLASLVFDSYVTLPEKFRESLITEYWVRLQENLNGGSFFPDRKSFDEALALTALQRNLKAIGTFAFQRVERGNSHYIKHIPSTVAHVRRHLSLLSGWDDLALLLELPLRALEKAGEKEMAH
ncbi:MAG: phosphotransferase [bacterium]